MSALRDMQTQFAAFVYAHNKSSADHNDILNYVAPLGTISPAGRMSIYRNNTLVGLSKALANAYPVVQRLVGEEFFDYAARQYILAYPSHSGDVRHFGQHFADFLASFEACKSLVYLPDVARLEQAFNNAYDASEHGPLPLGELAQIAPEHYERLCFHLHPSVTLLQSKYPIADIWDVNQEGAPDDATVNLDQGGCRLLIYRPQLAVNIVPLNSADYQLLKACGDNKSFGAACEAALSEQADFNIAESFQMWVARNALTGFTDQAAALIE